jgi:hypothetical protein
MNRMIERLALAAALVIGLVGCGQSRTSRPASTTVGATAATNPPGDIPDTQAFVTYTSPGGAFRALYPEGWARTVAGNDATFVWNYDGERLGWVAATAAPTASPSDPSIVALTKRFDAIAALHVTTATLPAGKTIVATFTSQSKPDPVTAKRLRLENSTFVFYRAGRVATLDLWAPMGADNVDQWQKLSRSFAWR